MPPPELEARAEAERTTDELRLTLTQSVTLRRRKWRPWSWRCNGPEGFETSPRSIGHARLNDSTRTLIASPPNSRQPGRPAVSPRLLLRVGCHAH